MDFKSFMKTFYCARLQWEPTHLPRHKKLSFCGWDALFDIYWYEDFFLLALTQMVNPSHNLTTLDNCSRTLGTHPENPTGETSLNNSYCFILRQCFISHDECVHMKVCSAKHSFTLWKCQPPIARGLTVAGTIIDSTQQLSMTKVWSWQQVRTIMTLLEHHEVSMTSQRVCDVLG